MPIATMTSKGQVTIPKEIRDRLRLRSGSRIEFIARGPDEAVVKPMTKTVDEVFGVLHRPGRKPLSIAAMDEAIRKRMRQRYG